MITISLLLLFIMSVYKYTPVIFTQCGPWSLISSESATMDEVSSRVGGLSFGRSRLVNDNNINDLEVTSRIHKGPNIFKVY